MSPDRKCVCFVLLYLCSFATSQPTKNTVEYPLVELTEEWRPEIGWVVNCSWDTGPDHLMSVDLRKDDELVARYRSSKEDDSSYKQIFTIPDNKLHLDCTESPNKCTLIIEPKMPQEKTFEISCEVKGDAPTFRDRKKALTIKQPVVPPSDAIIEVSKATEDSRPVLNCSSTGVPAPEIEWTVGDEDTKVDSVHSSQVWNVTTKQWHAWSTFRPASHQLPARCTAKVTKGEKGDFYVSKTAEYNKTTMRQIEIGSRSLIVAQPIRGYTVVGLTQEWRPEVGWVVTCSWDLAPHDRLQSVNLHKNSQHFADYRPAFNGPNLRHSFSTPVDDVQLTCEEKAANCTLIIEPMQPPKKDIDILCEVSGEGPLFRVGRQSLTIDTAVPPSKAILEVSKLTEESKPVLNCSSTGVPAPKIEWTTSGSDAKIPAINFHSFKVWNATSKLWYAWSTFIPASHQLPVTCTVKVMKGSNLYGITTAEYNGASRMEFENILGTILTTLFIVLMS